MTDRRYDDDEVAAIFGAAIKSGQASPSSGSDERGLTVADLQAIGRDVGISAEAIAQATRTIDVRRAAVSRTFLGLPIGVERTVTLDRRLSDEEWERLVVELREVFHARGTTRSDGSLRQWTNGNLYALLEPVAAGYRLRFGSVHGAARARITAGLATVGVGAVMAISSAAGGHLGGAVPAVVLTIAAGLGMVTVSAMQLSGWSRLRGGQIEALAARLAATAGESASPAVSSGGVDGG